MREANFILLIKVTPKCYKIQGKMLAEPFAVLLGTLNPSKAQWWSQGLQPLIVAPAGPETVPISAQVMDGSKADLLWCWECSSDPSRSWKWDMK